MKIIKDYNPVTVFNNDAEIADFLSYCYENEGLEVFQSALYDAMRHKGFANVAKQTGLSREALYKIKEREPKLSTLQKLMPVFGVKFKIQAA